MRLLNSSVLFSFILSSVNFALIFILLLCAHCKNECTYNLCGRRSVRAHISIEYMACYRDYYYYEYIITLYILNEHCFFFFCFFLSLCLVACFVVVVTLLSRKFNLLAHQMECAYVNALRIFLIPKIHCSTHMLVSMPLKRAHHITYSNSTRFNISIFC